jgi:molybdate transport system substrate-binding protein
MRHELRHIALPQHRSADFEPAMKTRTPIRAVRRRCAAAALLALACVAVHAADLTVSAAASLTNAFREIGTLFEAGNPGTKVLLNFGASDALLAQIAKGAPADVYASADQEAMDRAEAQKLLAPGSRRNFAGNALVVIVPGDSVLPLKTLADLRKPEVGRIALGNAGMPFGRYSRAALEAAGLWAAVEPKAVYAQNVRQSLDYVARGEVEAGFVYLTDAAVQKNKVRVAFTVATETPITYPIALVAGSPNPEGARRFVDFVLSPEGRSVLARYGFRKP